MEPVLNIKNLELDFMTRSGALHAIRGVNLQIFPGETLGLVGETGCGKSVTALSILRLIPSPPAKYVNGEIFYQGIDLLSLSMTEMQRVRGSRITMVFQDPATALNPVFTVGDQLIDVIQQHQKYKGMSSKARATKDAVEILGFVQLPDPERVMKAFPHELSGGMKQRIMIAMALSCKPDLLIADEPTTALDVTIQAQILRLIKQLTDKVGSAVLLITHDLGVVAKLCHRIAIMYCGSIVEMGEVKAIYHKPLHPYTIGLLNALPERSNRGEGLHVIPGTVPDLKSIPIGCAFAPRCSYAIDLCRKKKPILESPENGHSVACFNYLGSREINYD